MAWAVWVTGLPGSGKSSVARNASRMLAERGVHTRVLELDEMRKVVTPEPSYSPEERDIVYSALAYAASLLVEEGVNVIIDATANYRKYRELARKLIPDFEEVYVSCPLEVCIERESRRKAGHAPAGIYEKGLHGKSKTVPGINVPYEPPERPIVTVDTETLDQESAGNAAADAIERRFGGIHE